MGYRTMALTGSFGLPEVRQPSPETVQRQTGFPTVLLLMVTKSVGGFQQEKPIAVGMKPDELEIYHGEWLKVAANRAGYITSRIIPAPFVTPTA